MIGGRFNVHNFLKFISATLPCEYIDKVGYTLHRAPLETEEVGARYHTMQNVCLVVHLGLHVHVGQGQK